MPAALSLQPKTLSDALSGLRPRWVRANRARAKLMGLAQEAAYEGLIYPPSLRKVESMCRNIKPLFNFDPPATGAEVHEASLQFVRKISGFTKPSKANEAAFCEAVDDVARTAHLLLRSLVTDAPPRDREAEAAKARAKARRRFGVDGPLLPSAK